ncbi:hypothetical protein CVT26_008113 [Gymnopilus dilepis]|uniref:Uncharacterized protein n=1 Tax=Gymnopilus dilepis TaxID=231916 RepID=A0A409YJT0_9AGAR|nr:hypothetical protein CVT26_008113 [Gymnopilus dilepis]
MGLVFGNHVCSRKFSLFLTVFLAIHIISGTLEKRSSGLSPDSSPSSFISTAVLPECRLLLMGITSMATALSSHPYSLAQHKQSGIGIRKSFEDSRSGNPIMKAPSFETVLASFKTGGTYGLVFVSTHAVLQANAHIVSVSGDTFGYIRRSGSTLLPAQLSTLHLVDIFRIARLPHSRPSKSQWSSILPSTPPVSTSGPISPCTL